MDAKLSRPASPPLRWYQFRLSTLLAIVATVIVLAPPISKLECFSADFHYGLLPQSTRLEFVIGAGLLVAFVIWCGKYVFSTWRIASKRH